MTRAGTRLRCLPLFCALFVVPPPDAAAQPAEPIGPYVVDARGTLARFKGTPAVASALGSTSDAMPTRGLGLATGAHWYPVRLGPVTVGLGGEIVLARGSHTAEFVDQTAQAPTIGTRFSLVSPQLSLNFGNNDGWSYLSGGIGLARLESELVDRPFTEAADRVRALHYGGGARWFNTPRLAFTFDVRFYTIAAQEVAALRPAYPRMRFMVFSVGASMR